MNSFISDCPANMQEDILIAWYHHELNPDRDAAVQRHIASCNACQHYVSRYRSRSLSAQANDVAVSHEQPQTRQGAPQHRNSKKRTATLIAAVSIITVALVLLAVIFFQDRNNTASQTLSSASNIHTKATSTASPNPHANDPWALLPEFYKGQQTANTEFPHGRQALVFSLSNPLHGYFCGSNWTNPSLTSSANPNLVLFTTNDGGNTWQSTTTPFHAYGCLLGISPTNDNDIVIATWRSPNGSDDGVDNYNRSFDGGKTWQTLTPPIINDANFNSVIGYSWQGDTLYVIIGYKGSFGGSPTINHQILKSNTDGTFSIVQGDSFFAGQYIEEISSIGNDLLINSHYISRDNGNSWQTITFPNTTDTFQFSVSADQIHLIATSNTNKGVYISIDEGLHWQIQPSIASIDYTAADGSFFTTINGQNGVQEGQLLHSGTSTIAPSLPDIGQITISTDIHGHPIRLWLVTNTGIYSHNI